MFASFRRCDEGGGTILIATGIGNKDKKDVTEPGTVEHWARSTDNPVGGWYGLRKGYRGRFASYVVPVLERMGKVEFEKRGRGVWVRAI